MNPLTVAIADDHAAQRTFLKRAIAARPDFKLVGAVANGLALIDLVESQQPDLIITDLDMPVKNGIDAIKQLKASGCRSKILVYSSAADANRNALVALQYGALDILNKPTIDDEQSYQTAMSDISDKLLAIAEVASPKTFIKPPTDTNLTEPSFTHRRYIAIGGSMGGIQVLPTIFRQLDRFSQSTIFITQHMDEKFIAGFKNWLANVSPLPVKMAEHQESLKRGVVYVAPAEGHLQVHRDRIYIDPSPAVHGCRPAVEPMFDSLTTMGNQVCAVILSGMGKDGAQGLLALKNAGALTIAQTEETCAVFGMPGEAERLGAAQYRGSPEQIGQWLSNIARADQ